MQLSGSLPAPALERGADASDRSGKRQAGASVSVVARPYDVNPKWVFTWRRQYRELVRAAEDLVRVVVSSTDDVQPAKLLPAPKDIEPSASGRIEVALADGSRVIVDREVDATAVSRVFGVLESR